MGVSFLRLYTSPLGWSALTDLAFFFLFFPLHHCYYYFTTVTTNELASSITIS